MRRLVEGSEEFPEFANSRQEEFPSVNSGGLSNATLMGNRRQRGSTPTYNAAALQSCVYTLKDFAELTQ